MAIVHRIKLKPTDPAERALAQLKALSDPLPLELKRVLARDATLKLVLTLPEDVLSQALAVGKALQACAAHRRSFLGDQEEGYRKP